MASHNTLSLPVRENMKILDTSSLFYHFNASYHLALLMMGWCSFNPLIHGLFVIIFLGLLTFVRCRQPGFSIFNMPLKACCSRVSQKISRLGIARSGTCRSVLLRTAYQHHTCLPNCRPWILPREPSQNNNL